MQNSYEIELYYGTVRVWEKNWQGFSRLAAEFDSSQTPYEIRQELDELLSTAGFVVRLKEA